MLDRSDAVSDWLLLNALLNCASGATWVSIHHGRHKTARGEGVRARLAELASPFLIRRQAALVEQEVSQRDRLSRNHPKA